MKRKNDRLYEGMERFYNTVSGRSDNTILLTCLGLIIGIPLILIIGYWIDGTLTQYIWNHLVIQIPTFAPLGLKPIEFWEGLAISAAIGYFTKTSTWMLASKTDVNKLKPEEDRKYDGATQLFGYLVVRPIWGYIAVRIILHFMGLPG